MMSSSSIPVPANRSPAASDLPGAALEVRKSKERLVKTFYHKPLMERFRQLLQIHNYNNKLRYLARFFCCCMDCNKTYRTVEDRVACAVALEEGWFKDL